MALNKIIFHYYYQRLRGMKPTSSFTLVFFYWVPTQAIFSRDYMPAAASLGIGLAFDSFNVEQKWGDRPVLQKAVLVVNLALVAAMFGFGIGLNDK